MAEKIQLVRHGRYDNFGLTVEGRHDAEMAGKTLLERGLGSRAVILSSSALRAAQTADIIAKTLGVEQALLSDIINIAGNSPEVIRDFDVVLAKALAEHNIEEVDDGLIVVAHQPLLALVQYGSPLKGVGHGGVVEYVPGSWTANEYEPNGLMTKQFEEDFGLTLSRYNLKNP